jgi:hypothetical protein
MAAAEMANAGGGPIASDNRAHDVIRRKEVMYADRSVTESMWRQIADRIDPANNVFQKTYWTPGEYRGYRQFDSSPIIVIQKFAAAMQAMLTPENSRYQKLVPPKNLEGNKAVETYLARVTDVLFDFRYAPYANFTSQVDQSYQNLGRYGTQSLYIDWIPGHGMHYHSVPLNWSYIAENNHHVIDTHYRDVRFTARQAVQQFGKDRLPQVIQKAAENHTQCDSTFDFIHAVEPNPEFQQGRIDWRGKRYRSLYVSVQGEKVVDEGGYRCLPYAVSRFFQAPGEVYGRSPGWNLLPDIKMLNEMKKTQIRAAQKAVDPPMLLPEDGALTGFDLTAGALNYGGISDDGKQMAMALQLGANFDIGKQGIQETRELLNDGFFINLFQILVQDHDMTATEAMLRAQEKGQLLAPTFGRQQAEFLNPITRRELDLLYAVPGLMETLVGPMPPELLQAGGVYNTEFDSPLNRMQRAGDVVAFGQTFQALAPIAQADPTVLQVFDFEKVAAGVAKINGVPPEWMRSAEELAQMKQQQASQAQMQSILQAAPVAASAAKDMAQAQATAQSQPQPVTAGAP